MSSHTKKNRLTIIFLTKIHNFNQNMIKKYAKRYFIGKMK